MFEPLLRGVGSRLSLSIRFGPSLASICSAASRNSPNPFEASAATPRSRAAAPQPPAVRAIAAWTSRRTSAVRSRAAVAASFSASATAASSTSALMAASTARRGASSSSSLPRSDASDEAAGSAASAGATTRSPTSRDASDWASASASETPSPYIPVRRRATTHARSSAVGAVKWRSTRPGKPQKNVRTANENERSHRSSSLTEMSLSKRHTFVTARVRGERVKKASSLTKSVRS